MSGKANILSIWEQSTEAERAEGMQWYTQARVAAGKLSDSLQTACGVIAAISPGLLWDVNILAAGRLIEGNSIKGLGRIWPANQVKAYRIIRGHDPRIVLGGNKVRAFYHCILNPSDWFHVCVDGHAYGIWSGKRIPLGSTPKITDRRYRTISMDFVRASDKVGVLPNQVQAVTWLAWRRIHGLGNLTIANYKVGYSGG